MSLSEIHQRLHAAIMTRVEAALVQATLLAFDRARAELSKAQQLIDGHHRPEEDAISQLPPDTPLPRGAGAHIIANEHLKLDKAFTQAHALFDALQALDPDVQRLALVRYMDQLLTLRHLLEHHTQREVDLVYPLLETQLPPAAQAPLRDILQQLLRSDEAAGAPPLLGRL